MLNTLNVAQTGLRTSQTQAENVMNNIANENVDGYKKRVVDTSEIQHSDARITGRGVLVDGVSRTTNIYMYKNIITENGKLNSYSQLNSMLGDIESMFSETDDAGLSSDLNNYFESIENLRTSPSNEVYKNDIVSNANSMVSDLQTLYSNIESKEGLVLNEAQDTVDKVNSILKQIGEVSKKITDSTGGTPNDLLDKRDSLEKELSQYVDVDISRDDSYQLKIAGVTAVRFDTNVHEVNLVQNYTPQQDVYALKNSDGTTSTAGINGDYESSLPAFSGTGVAGTSEVQTVDIMGAIDDGSGDPTGTAKTINVLGQTINVAMGDSAATVATAIGAAAGAYGDADGASIIGTWNAHNPQKEIDSISVAGTTVTVTYRDTEGDVPPLDVAGTSSKGIIFYNNQEVTKGFSPRVGEAQTLEITGDVDDGSSDAAGTAKTIDFLGYSLSVNMGDDQASVTNSVVAAAGTYGDAAGVSIIGTWNATHPDQEIASIQKGAKSNELIITYASGEGDVASLPNTSSNGVNFSGSVEEVKGSTESLTYVLNDTYKITATVGDVVKDEQGNVVDFDASGGGGVITQNNIIQALIYKINNDKDIGGTITAYNGKYDLDADGNKILTNDPDHAKYQDPTTAAPANPNNPGFADRYLFIEANVDGEAGDFKGELLVNDNNSRQLATTNDTVSKEGINDIHLEIYDKEIDLSSGSLKPMIDNIKTDSGNNLIKEYKEKLDNFAAKLADLTSSYIENSDGSYVSGTNAVDVNYDADKKVSVGLFSGSSVKTLSFNEGNINSINQDKLDYLASLQWKTDIDFDGTGENNQSFADYYKTLQVSVSDSKESVNFNEESQKAVTESLQSSYDQLTKVDKDEEMVNLIKFQSAYSANAKVITTIDEMLQTLLGIKQ